MSPFQSWYGEPCNARDLHISGCRMLVPDHDMKKSADRAKVGKFYGYAKVRALLRWIDIVTNCVKHAHGTQFLELEPTSEVCTPGQRLFQLGLRTLPVISSSLCALSTLAIALILKQSLSRFMFPCPQLVRTLAFNSHSMKYIISCMLCIWIPAHYLAKLSLPDITGASTCCTLSTMIQSPSMKSFTGVNIGR
jgi:hypothetical protein